MSLACGLPRSAGWRGARETDKSEAVLRAAWNDPKQPYGSRKAALRGLVRLESQGSPKLLEEALKITAGDHTIAADALDLSLATAGSQGPRAGAALHAKYGQPQSLRFDGHRRLRPAGQG